jgi:hypothetical protein
VAEIATAFPGLFSYGEVLSLDVRDFTWWRRKAEIHNARKKADEMNMMRVSYWGDKDEFHSEIRDLQDRIDLLEAREWTNEEVRSNWQGCMADLKSAMSKMRK